MTDNTNSSFVIIPDTSCDLGKELRDRFSIPDYLRGTVVFPDGQSRKSDLDWNGITPEEYYTLMKEKGLITTAAANIDEAVELFSVYLEKGLDILSVSLSSALSGTYSICSKAAEALRARYPDRRIICVDSLRYSTSLSLLIVMACAMQQAGKSLDETAAWMEENKHRIHQMGAMDDLFFLCKTGRISNFKAFFGTLVGVNPMADFNRDGLSEVIYKCKGKQTAFKMTVEYMKRTIVSPEDSIVFVAHSNRAEFAEKLRELIEKEIKPKEIIISEIGMSCGASIGPGLVAAFYYGSEISEGLKREKELMAAIAEELKTQK